MRPTWFLRYEKNGRRSYRVRGRTFLSRRRDLRVPEKHFFREVVILEEEAFRMDPSLRTVALPGSVGRICRAAFYACEKLETVLCGDGLCSIEEEAFARCDALHTVTLPHSVRVIGREAFSACFALKGIDLSAVEEIGPMAFSHCKALTHAVMPQGRCRIAPDAFFGCGLYTETRRESDGYGVVDGWLFSVPDGLSEIRLGRDIRAIISDAFLFYRATEEVPNPQYESEAARYEEEEAAHERWKTDGHAPFVPAPDFYPKKVRKVPVPIRFFYEGSMDEWRGVRFFPGERPYPYEVVCTDGRIHFLR